MPERTAARRVLANLSSIGAHHRTYRAATTNELGATLAAGRDVTALCSGMNYWDGSQWRPSEPSFSLSLQGDAFIASRVHARTRLAGNLNVAGAVEITNGTNTLACTPLALALFDAASGRLQIVGQLTNCSPSLVSSNEVVYENAFSGILADVIYRIEKGTIEQDLAIRCRIPFEAYGFSTNPASLSTLRLQVISEFFGAPEPERVLRPIFVEQDQRVRSRRVEPDLVDEQLGFGELVFSAGHAFMTPRPQSLAHPGAIVAKTYRTVAGRSLLIESVEVPAIREHLDALPDCGLHASVLPASNAVRGYAALVKPPARASAFVMSPKKSIELASAMRSRPGLVVDFLMQVGPGSINDPVVFDGAGTFYVAGPVYLNSSTTISGGAVFKYPRSNGEHATTAFLQINGSLTLRAAGQYRPIIFSAVDDECAGESLYGIESCPYYTGIIDEGAYYANPAVSLNNVSSSLGFCRFRYCQEGLKLNGTSTSAYGLSHSQFVKCLRGISLQGGSGGCGGCGGAGTFLTVNNVLMAQVAKPFTSSVSFPYTAALTHCTIDGQGATLITNSTFALATFALTNSILSGISVRNAGSAAFVGMKNGFYQCGPNVPFGGAPITLAPGASSPFQRVDSGQFYLATDSPFKAVGVTSILWLASEFRTRTTSPPLSLPVNMEITGELALMPRVPRYASGAPDIGYWYDSLDYTVANAFCEGAKITVTPGTAISVRNDVDPFDSWGWSSAGFCMWENSSFICEGTPNTPNVITASRYVQEGPYENWYHLGYAWPLENVVFGIDWQGEPEVDPLPSLKFRFCNFSLPFEDYHLAAGMWEARPFWPMRVSLAWQASTFDWVVRDSRFNGGSIGAGPTTWYPELPPCSLSWMNNSFEGVYVYIDPEDSFHAEMYNNLFRNSFLIFYPVSSVDGNWRICDSLIDSVSIAQYSPLLPLDHHHNGYWNSTAWPVNNDDGGTTPDSTGDILLQSAPTYQSSVFGPYYLPQTLVLPGSRSAADAGLYHYTSLTNQTKEAGQSNVRMGVHYVAANVPSGQPTDYDADQIPDYVENAAGDGLYTSHVGIETDWQDAQTLDGIADKFNATYDDVDLDGDRLVGRLEKALNKNPLIPDNPITLAVIVKGEEPDIIALKVPISLTSLESIGTLKLLVDGNDAEFQECGSDADGLCLLRWNTTYHPAGSHFIQAQIKLKGQTSQTSPSESGILTALGSPIAYHSYNNFQFDSVYGDYSAGDAILYAKVADEAQPYSIELSDSSGNHISTITVPSTSGEIKQTWDVTYDDANHTPYTGSSVIATYSILPNRTSPSKQFLHLTPVRSLDNIEGNFDVAYAWHNGYFANGAMRDCMQWGVVDPLIKPFNYYNWYNSTWNDFSSPQNRGNPGLLTDNETDRIQLMQDLALEDTRNFYFQGHGSSDSIGDGVDDQHPGNVQIDTDFMRSYLHNTFSFHGAVLEHPYRFVFLDSCNSADTLDWAHAFGIGSRVTYAQLADRPWKAQAFVGWVKKPRCATSEAEWRDYTSTLGVFFGCWMSGFTVDECIDKASAFSPGDPFPGTFLYFPLGQKFTLAEQLFGYRNDFHIRVYGYAGLTRSGYQPGHDNSRHYQ